MHWYLIEVLPLFVAASALIWLGKMTGGFTWLLHKLMPVMELLGLPPEAAKIFIFGFFRRDYGAAGLYDLMQTGSLTMHQQVVVATVLTLFIPCVAQLAVMVKERGWMITLGMAGCIFPFAFLTGCFLHRLLTVLHIVFE
jgi:ferrous iron transport protein B